MKLTKLEIQKLIEPFNLIIIIVMIILSAVMVFNIYNEGQSFSLYNGETYQYRGKDYINNNKKYAYQYSDRIVDDIFFLDLEMQEIDSYIFDKDGIQDVEKYTVIISSLSQYYNSFPKLDDKKIYGEISTDIKSVFKGELPVFKYTDNWRAMKNIISNIQLLLIITAVISAPLMFSKEYSSGMTPIILPAKNGRKTFALSKISAFYIFISGLYLFINLSAIISVGCLWGFENAFADIRIMTNAAYITMEHPISCISLIFLQLLIGYLNIIIISSIGIFISSLIKSPYIAVIATACVFFFPLLIKMENITSDTMRKAVMLLPYNSLRILSLEWSVFDYSLGVILIILLITAVVSSVSLIFSVKLYSSHKIS